MLHMSNRKRYLDSILDWYKNLGSANVEQGKAQTTGVYGVEKMVSK